MPNNWSPLNSSQLNALPSLNQVIGFCPNMQYIHTLAQNTPLGGLFDNGLIAKANSTIFCASGSTASNQIVFANIILRPDEQHTVIDQNPLITVYDLSNGQPLFGGFIHHGDWDGRTIPLEPWQTDILMQSGLTASLQLLQPPLGPTGSLLDLPDGVLRGFHKAAQIGYLNQKQ